MANLAVKYRPKEFDEVLSQNFIKLVLQKQLENNSFSNAYLFSGPSGCGKTTLARIFANKINNNIAPYEIDAASHSSVDTTRELIDFAQQRDLVAKYKIIILDECHMLTRQAWASLLKTIEETSKYTIFMFCTTDIQKVPETIINRCMRFNLSSVESSEIFKRLVYIVKEENINISEDILRYIATISSGCVRQAIMNLDTVINSGVSSIQEVYSLFGYINLKYFFELTDIIMSKDKAKTIAKLDEAYLQGINPLQLVEQYVTFIFNLIRYYLLNNLEITYFGKEYIKMLEYLFRYKDKLEKLLDILMQLRYGLNRDTQQKITIQYYLLQFINGEESC